MRANAIREYDWRKAARLLIVCIAAAGLIDCGAASHEVAPAPSPPQDLYDANPEHLWNRIHERFHVRVAPDGSEYGFDTVDPLLWRETRYLVSQPSHAQAVGVLDEFLAANAEHLVTDPLKRAVFQHDLWAVFDWLVSTSEGGKAARTALMQRLARVMRRVALSRKNIEALPDTYAAAVASGAFPGRADPSQQVPFLPHDLFTVTGPWVSIGGTQPIVPQHAAELGRSAFIVLWNVPGGRAATVSFLRKLWDVPQPFVLDETFPNDGEARVKLNPALPPVPDGSRVALVRKMLVIDDGGVIVPTNLVQSIQLRVFSERQSFSELIMSRTELFAGKSGGLRAVGADERGFLTFSAKGMDPLEGKFWRGPGHIGRVLDTCRMCHQVDFQSSIETVRSIRGMLRPFTFVDSSHERWARWFTQPILAAEAKGRSYEWGILEGLWLSQPR